MFRLTDFDERNTHGDQHTGYEPEKAITFFEQKNAHKDGKEGSALSDADGITDIGGFQSKTVGDMRKKKENPPQQDTVGVNSVAIKRTASDTLVEYYHESKIDKNHGHQPHGKDIKA